jgi:hypothetical protein
MAAVPDGGETMGFLPDLPAAPDRAVHLKAAIASTLLACLELAMNGELCLEQASAWGAIDVSPCGDPLARPAPTARPRTHPGDRLRRAARAEIRARQPILDHVPDAHLTHCATLPMPSAPGQALLCAADRARAFERGVGHGVPVLPPAVVVATGGRRRAAERGLSAVPVKWRQYGINAEQRAELDDPVRDTVLQDSNDQATAMVARHLS